MVIFSRRVQIDDWKARLAAAVVTIGLLMARHPDAARSRSAVSSRTIEDSTLCVTRRRPLGGVTSVRVGRGGFTGYVPSSKAAPDAWSNRPDYFRSGPAGSTGLFPLLDLTTSLDPRFNLAYRFGAIFLAEPAPGPGRPDLAIALLQKGLAERPDRWEYMQDIGFVHYWWKQDYQTAAEWSRRASEVQGAPWWLKSLAATTLAVGGDRRSSRVMWEAIRESAEIDFLRRDAERHLAQLRALDDIDALQPFVDRVTAQSGTPPRDWLPVVRAAGWRGIPADPTGTPYEIDEHGRVQLSRSSPLADRVPTEANRRRAACMNDAPLARDRRTLAPSWQLPQRLHLLAADRRRSSGRSAPNCHREIEWFENIPIFSWLVLRGCRTCKHPINAVSDRRSDPR
jgi:hypothetical protein